MQRLHEDDLAGHLLEQGNWQHLDLPAIAIEDGTIPIGPGKLFTRRENDVLHPERESQAALDRIKAEIGNLRFSAQYQQRPVPVASNLIKREWFRFYEQAPQPGAGDRIVQSWDIATMIGEANDYSVCTTWCMVNSDYYLMDVFRGRLPYPDLRRKVVALCARHNADAIVIEDAGPGMQLLQDLHHDLP